MALISEVRVRLWAAIKMKQDSGIQIRNYRMSKTFGGDRGLLWHERKDSKVPLCLLGALDATPMGRRPFNEYETAAVRLDITVTEAVHLEAGFEGWSVDVADQEDPFYQLGREIGMKLEEEEAKQHAHV